MPITEISTVPTSSHRSGMSGDRRNLSESSSDHDSTKKVSRVPKEFLIGKVLFVGLLHMHYFFQ